MSKDRNLSSLDAEVARLDEELARRCSSQDRGRTEQERGATELAALRRDLRAFDESGRSRRLAVALCVLLTLSILTFSALLAGLP